MKAHLLVFATSLCLTAAFATPVSAASTTTSSKATKAEEPSVACNLKGCWVIDKKTPPKSETKDSSSSNGNPHSGAPHP